MDLSEIFRVTPWCEGLVMFVVFEFGDPFGSDLSSVRNLYFVVK